KERGSILSTVRRHLDFLDDTRIVASLARSDLNLDDLKRKPMTIYLVMPPSRLEANKRYIRAFVGQCLAAITASNEKPAYKVAFLLDEFAQLGRMQAVEDAISLVRGYGAAFWLFVQDLSQLKAIYPKWQTFLANTGKQFFGTADYDTAKFISDSLGKFTVEYRTQGSSSSMGTANLHGSTGSSDNQQFTGRDLLTPDEVMRLPPDRPVVMMTGEAPYVLQRLNYLTDPEYAGLFDPNPYH
ncbi:type IV secretory system conjugative DNA transfer family protein, partial [Klebsiella pneumoniae]